MNIKSKLKRVSGKLTLPNKYMDIALPLLGFLGLAAYVGSGAVKPPAASGTPGTGTQLPATPIIPADPYQNVTLSTPVNNSTQKKLSYNSDDPIASSQPVKPYNPTDTTDYGKARSVVLISNQQNLDMLISEGVLAPGSLAAKQNQWAIDKDTFWFGLLASYGLNDNVFQSQEQRDKYDRAQAELNAWMKANPRPY